MSAIPFELGIKFAWFKAPDLEFWEWTKAAQRLWAWLKRTTHGDQTQFRFTDRELAEELGIGRRYVQYALQWLEEHGIIRRVKIYGPRHKAGRVIEITIELAGRAHTTAQAAARKPTAPAPPTGPLPTRQAPTTQPEPEPEPTPEEIRAAEDAMAQIRLKFAQQAAARNAKPEERHQARQAQQRILEAQHLLRRIDEVRRRLAELQAIPQSAGTHSSCPKSPGSPR